LRFREAIGALHDVVVSDLRYKPPDKSVLEAYNAEQKRIETELRGAVSKRTRAEIGASQPELPEPYSAELEKTVSPAPIRVLEEADRILQLL